MGFSDKNPQKFKPKHGDSETGDSTRKAVEVTI